MMTNNSCGQNSPAYKEAVRRQAEATSPENSVFVSANAGTGKTHVLTNRVLRLLLSGASPDLYQGRGCRNALQTVRKITEMGCV